MSNWTASQNNPISDIRDAMARPRPRKSVLIVGPETHANLFKIARPEGSPKEPSAEDLERDARLTAALGEHAMLLIFGRAVHRAPLDYIGR